MVFRGKPQVKLPFGPRIGFVPANPSERIQVTARIHIKGVAAADELAQLEGVDRSEIIRRALAEYVPARLKKLRRDNQPHKTVPKPVRKKT